MICCMICNQEPYENKTETAIKVHYLPFSQDFSIRTNNFLVHSKQTIKSLSLGNSTVLQVQVFLAES